MEVEAGTYEQDADRAPAPEAVIVSWMTSGTAMGLPPGRDAGERRLEDGELGVAHELKNALGAVKALVQLGLRNPAEAASHERLARLEEVVARMEEMLRRPLSLARWRTSSGRVDAGQLVDEALRALSPRADAAGVRLSAGGGGYVHGDRRSLGEAVSNLVANAIEATPPGGEVAVEIRPAPGVVEIAVRDTGRGMPPDTLRRVGTPFFTTRAEGSGLGVALARSIVDAHGGTLRYDSEPGKGTTVRAALPGGAAGVERGGARAALAPPDVTPLRCRVRGR